MMNDTWMEKGSDADLIIEKIERRSPGYYGMGWGPYGTQIQVCVNQKDLWYVGLSDYSVSINFIISPEDAMDILCGMDESPFPLQKVTEAGGRVIPIRRYSEYYKYREYGFFQIFQLLRYISRNRGEEWMDSYITSITHKHLSEIEIPDMDNYDWEIENPDILRYKR